MNKSFTVSVIIPVYKVENYLRETIESVIHQTLGFDKIQLILVNDGSPDNSEKICLEYKEKYPDNVVYIKQENAGVSAARNHGLRYATGKYVNFLDSDDKWDKEAFKKGVSLLEKYPETGFAIYPMKYFEGSTAFHTLHPMFTKTRRYDIREDYSLIKMSSCSILFRRTVLENHSFSQTLKVAEDSKLVTEIALENPINIMISDCNYNYRKRKNQSSTMQSLLTDTTWYLDIPKYFWQEIIDLSIKKYGKVLKYVQYILIYDLHWRLSTDPKNYLSKKEANQYYKLLLNTMKFLDDEVIASFSMMKMHERLYFLNFKHQDNKVYQLKDHTVSIEDSTICDFSNLPVTIDTVFIEKNVMQIYGKLPLIPHVLEDVVMEDEKGKTFSCEHYDLATTAKNFLAIQKELNFPTKGFHFSIDLSDSKCLSLYGVKGKKRIGLNLTFSYHCHFNNEFDKLYLRAKDYYVRAFDNHFSIYKKGFKNSIKLETSCLVGILKEKKFKSFIYRFLALVLGAFKRKEIWILSDRVAAAEDNGQAFFEYLNTIHDKKRKFYFAISKNTKSYQELKAKYKNVIGYNSFRHKLLHLNADRIVSAHADQIVINLFGKGKYYLSDLYRFKYVFLQHGITKDDLSPWLNINSIIIDLFITCAKEEYRSISSGNYCYGFPKEWVKLTGLARYDKLLKQDCDLKKQILIMPTWRTKLAGVTNRQTGEIFYNSKFKQTEYFKFYNSLINDKRLIKAVKKAGYRIKFIPHNNMKAQISDFEKNEYVDFLVDNVKYSHEFKENKLLVTDYSSVAFDFCYLKKPVIFCQFDREDFYAGQIYDKGFYDYDKDGMGPVTLTLEDTVDAIIKAIENDCILEEKYKKRIEKFYEYIDQNNCKRIYEEILKLAERE